ncbi:MAG: hypothetical protein GY756_24580 [bacterium]|nr:hypothetical protein [bacterium]
MKKITLILLAIALSGCFITNAAGIKQQKNTETKNLTQSIKSINQLDNQTTAQYIKLINSVKPTTVTVKDDNSTINKMTAEVKNNKDINALDTQITTQYIKLVNDV